MRGSGSPFRYKSRPEKKKPLLPDDEVLSEDAEAGKRPAAALRAAQAEMWKQKQWQSPYYWDAITMQGEWR
jgi:hypothetical protein